MLPKRLPRIFFDTSALFSAIYSESGGARQLTRLSETGAIQIIISVNVVQEIERVVGRNRRKPLLKTAEFIEAAKITLVPTPEEQYLLKASTLIKYTPDAIIFAGALADRAEYFVTLDKADFLHNLNLLNHTEPIIGTPGDCIAWLRALW